MSRVSILHIVYDVKKWNQNRNPSHNRRSGGNSERKTNEIILIMLNKILIKSILNFRMIDVAIIGAGIAGVTVLGRKSRKFSWHFEKYLTRLHLMFLTYFIAASRLHRKLSIRVFEALSAVNGHYQSSSFVLNKTDVLYGFRLNFRCKIT